MGGLSPFVIGGCVVIWRVVVLVGLLLSGDVFAKEQDFLVAQQAYACHQYDKALQHYQKALKAGDKRVYMALGDFLF
ncbi:hypothetical protein HBZS_102570 [Helicobacter bizzozeronii CCUG 35545]|nr:hypothetical protein HBZS_102570 [Helicobacter bizzozeronii CCUG 35545]